MASVPSLTPIGPRAFLPSFMYALNRWHYAIIYQMQQLVACRISSFPLLCLSLFQSDLQTAKPQLTTDKI